MTPELARSSSLSLASGSAFAQRADVAMIRALGATQYCPIGRVTPPDGTAALSESADLDVGVLKVSCRGDGFEPLIQRRQVADRRNLADPDRCRPNYFPVTRSRDRLTQPCPPRFLDEVLGQLPVGHPCMHDTPHDGQHRLHVGSAHVARKPLTPRGVITLDGAHNPATYAPGLTPSEHRLDTEHP